MLDVVTAALYHTDEPRQIRANVQVFPAATGRGERRQRLLASLFAADVATSDHGPEIRTATMETLAAFMVENGLAEHSFEVAPNGAIRPVQLRH